MAPIISYSAVLKNGSLMGCGKVGTLNLPEMMIAMNGDGLIMPTHGEKLQSGFNYSYISVAQLDRNKQLFAINPEIKIDGAKRKQFLDDFSDETIVVASTSLATYVNNKKPDMGKKLEDGRFEFDLDMSFRDTDQTLYGKIFINSFKPDSHYFYSNMSGRELISNFKDLKENCDYKLRIPTDVDTKSFEIDIVEICDSETVEQLTCFLK